MAISLNMAIRLKPSRAAEVGKHPAPIRRLSQLDTILYLGKKRPRDSEDIRAIDAVASCYAALADLLDMLPNELLEAHLDFYTTDEVISIYEELNGD